MRRQLTKWLNRLQWDSRTRRAGRRSPAPDDAVLVHLFLRQPRQRPFDDGVDLTARRGEVIRDH